MPHSRRLSAPLYESLPWAYLGAGVLALVGSYFSTHRPVSWISGALGLVGVLGGSVVLLRRRDYRALSSQYGDAGKTLPGMDEPRP
ncbi:MAG: hypothetical protein JOZ12_07090 [Sinobacteraceae bacterium]|nr:hypothetical protein [Nevskiaceae bacterium]MBV9912696.1 hypothetical protein [Nevskiaceae bacterium]